MVEKEQIPWTISDKKKFCEKAATNITRIEPQTLPPASAAAKYHSFRVFYQIVQWKGSPVELLPEEWGWIVTEDGIHPTPTDIAAAPDSLLKVIRCSCKTDCKSQRCSCRKHDLKCTLACTHCCGTDCQNASLTPLQEDEPYEDDPLEVWIFSWCKTLLLFDTPWIVIKLFFFP